jgi:putative SOS response-associated peptidase YedK
MCNEYQRLNELTALTDEEWSRLVPVQWAGGRIPNIGPQPNIRITERAAIARRTADGVELSMTPWAWKGPRGAPVFNFKSEGRSFANSDRCLIPADGFFEYTAPANPKQKLKDKHLFTLAGEPWFWIAGLVKDGAFTMLTTEPGPDIVPYHNRQIVVLPRAAGMDWLDLTKPEAEILRALPAGSLAHEQVR